MHASLQKLPFVWLLQLQCLSNYSEYYATKHIVPFPRHVRELQYSTISGLQYVPIPELLQTPDCKDILVTANYGQLQSACMEYNT